MHWKNGDNSEILANFVALLGNLKPFPKSSIIDFLKQTLYYLSYIWYITLGQKNKKTKKKKKQQKKKHRIECAWFWHDSLLIIHDGEWHYFIFTTVRQEKTEFTNIWPPNCIHTASPLSRSKVTVTSPLWLGISALLSYTRTYSRSLI